MGFLMRGAAPMYTRSLITVTVSGSLVVFSSTLPCPLITLFILLHCLEYVRAIMASGRKGFNTALSFYLSSCCWIAMKFTAFT